MPLIGKFIGLSLMIMASCVPALAMDDSAPQNPLIIAHRGASGERPEHTLAAYERAIDQGADYIEPDLVMTKDGVLVARHENLINDTTDVAARPEFANRRTVKTIDGVEMTGWFTEDFTLRELQTLRVKERLGQLRPANQAFDGLYPIATLTEIIDLVKAKQAEGNRVIGLYPETKHPSYFAAIGLPMEQLLVRVLKDHGGYDDAAAPVFIQSFEVANLKALKALTDLRLIQLMAPNESPFDAPMTSYADMITPAGLAAIAQYADGIGVHKDMVIPRDANGDLSSPTGLVAAAHAVGLHVHLWTFRRENYFLPTAYRRADDLAETGNLAGEIQRYAATGIDGLFTDNTAEAVMALRGLRQ